MKAYSAFAEIYDLCMDNIPYDRWSEYLISLLREYGVEDGIVAELGCGTGEITARLQRAGYDMIGLDASAEMLGVAREKEYDTEEPSGILYLLQDMREMELFGTVRAFVSVCDSMNYLLTEEDLLRTFRLVNNYLEKDGVFIFDMKSEYFFSEVVADEVRVEHWEDGTLIWENEYDSEQRCNRYELTIYRRIDNEAYERVTEEHVQRVYTVERLKKLLELAGLCFVAAYDACTREPVSATTERFYIIAKEGFQEGKHYE